MFCNNTLEKKKSLKLTYLFPFTRLTSYYIVCAVRYYQTATDIFVGRVDAISPT